MMCPPASTTAMVPPGAACACAYATAAVAAFFAPASVRVGSLAMSAPVAERTASHMSQRASEDDFTAWLLGLYAPNAHGIDSTPNSTPFAVPRLLRSGAAT